MSYKVDFYYSKYHRKVTLNVPCSDRSDALKWVDALIEKHDSIIPEGWDNWIIPNANKRCVDYNNES